MSNILVNFRGENKRIGPKDARRQLQTMKEILKRLNSQPGVILSDEVGMGKTYIALGVIADYLMRYKRSQVLILTPSADLAEKWAKDLDRFREENVNKNVQQHMRIPRKRRNKGKDHQSEETIPIYEMSLPEILDSQHNGRVWILPIGIFLQHREHQARRRRGRQPPDITYQLLSKAASADRATRRLLWRLISGRKSRLPKIVRRLTWMNEPVPSLKIGIRKILHEEGVLTRKGIARWKLTSAVVCRLRDDIRWLLIRARLRKFSLIVVDEAHHLRNPDSKRHRAMERIFEKTFRDMLFLTATPFQLGPDELENVLNLFRLSKERQGRWMPEKAKRITDVARTYQKAVRTFEECWKRLEPHDKDVVCKVFRHGRSVSVRGTRGLDDFQEAYDLLKTSHRQLQQTLMPWVMRSVKDRSYRKTVIPEALDIKEINTLPFALLHRLLYEYQRHHRTFAATQHVSLTSSWAAFRKSNVMTGGTGSSGVRFYRKAIKDVIGSKTDADHPKLNALVEIVEKAFSISGEEGLKEREKVLVFTSRIETVKYLHSYLNRRLEDHLYQSIGGFSREKIDHDLRSFRKQTLNDRDPLRLILRENYYKTLLTERDRKRLGKRRVVDRVINNLARVKRRYRLNRGGKIHWLLLCYLCELAVFQLMKQIAPTRYAKEPVWRYNAETMPWHIDDRRHKINRRSSRWNEASVLRRHSCTRMELSTWVNAVLYRDSIWDPYAHILDRLGDTTDSNNILLRELLLDAIERVLFVPEIMGPLLVAKRNQRRGEAKRLLAGVLKNGGIGLMVERFLEEITRLPDTEKWEYTKGLRTEQLVARASGEQSVVDRRRYRYGFNTPFRPYILVASDVMQEGLDLHKECACIVHYDLAWNPARLEQRVGRVDRLGSKVDREQAHNRKLFIHRRYIPGTIDERMYLRVTDRERWFKFILGHRPDWEVDSDGKIETQKLPEYFGNRFRIQLAPTGRRYGAPTSGVEK